MNAQKILSIILVILMAIPLVPLAPAQAQTPKIETSADPHGGLFTNNTWIEVKVTDTARAGSGQVTVNVYKNGVVQTSINLTEVGSSGIFVAYVLFNSTTNDTAAGWSTGYGTVPLKPQNPLANKFLYNGTDFTITLAADDTITFEYIGPGGTVTTDITYKAYTAEISVDRTNVPAFGNATVYVTVSDQDFNYDPTAVDTITNYKLNFTLVDKLGNTYKGPVTYPIILTETGANTAEFTNSVTIDQVFTTLGYAGTYYNITQDYNGNNYTWVNFTTIANGTVPFDHICFRSMDDTGVKVYLTRTNGLASIPSQVSLASELSITVTDEDANLDTKAKDTIYVNVTLTDFTGTPKNMIVALQETGENTGEFTGTVYLSYDDTEHIDAAATTFYVNATRSILVEYKDASADSVVAAVDTTMTDYAPTLTVEPTQALPTGTITITLEDMDLNDKGDDAVDSFGQSVNANDALKIQFANNKQGYLEVLRDNQLLNASKNFFIFFEEVEPGVFQATFELSWILQTLQDGDEIVFKWVDVYSGEEASATVTISKPEITVSLDRDTYPMPASGQFEVYITVNNAFANTNPGIKDTISRTAISAEVILWNGTALTAANGTIIGLGDLVETDVDTGVFVGSFTVDITADPIVFTGATIKVYYNFSGNIYEASAVIRPSTASMTVNATTLAMGDYIYITLVEPDANTDSMQEETVQIDVSGDVTGTITLTETGVNTGVFEATLRIGVDAPLNFADPYKSFELSFYDNFTAETSVTYQRDTTITIGVSVKAHDAEFYIGSPDADVEAVGPYSAVTVYFKDPDYILLWENGNNLTLATDEAIYVRSLLGTDLRITTLTPAEEPATFEATIQLTFVDDPQAGADLNVTVPDNLVFRFVDPVAADGNSKAVVKWLKVMAWDGEVEVVPNKPFYNDKEDILIRVTDPDQNTDPNRQESVDVKITSWRMVGGELQPVDPAGATITLVETEPDSGVFEAPYTIDTEKYPPFFNVGDMLKIEYEDPIAADGKTKVTSSVTLQIGFTTATPITPGAAEEVQVADITGTPTTPKAGMPITLQVPVSNIDTTRAVTVDVILVAYKDGVPMGIGIAQVTIGAGQSTVVNVPWIPATAGDYEVKIFFWDLANKTPLAEEPLVLSITVQE